MFIVNFENPNYGFYSWANTLLPDYIGTHENGWTITGEIKEDYYEWVNEFEAIHPIYGRVYGNFETTVFADNEEGYNDFVKIFHLKNGIIQIFNVNKILLLK